MEQEQPKPKRPRGRPRTDPEQKAINSRISKEKWRAKNRNKANVAAKAHYEQNKEEINTRKKLARLEARLAKLAEYKETLKKYDKREEITV